MVDNIFNKKFKEITKGEYPDVKFYKAEFNRAENSAVLYFLYSDKNCKLSDSDKKNIIEVVKGVMPAGVKINLNFTKCYADEHVVKNKVAQYFNKEEPIVFKQLSSDDFIISLDGYNINVTVRAVKELLLILEAGDHVQKLSDYLDGFFVENINVSFIEKYFDRSKMSFAPIVASETAIEGVRLVKIEVGELLYGRGSLTVAPSYICDAKAGEQCQTYCGKVRNFEVKQYKNKDYGSEPRQSGRRKINTTDEYIPFYKFSVYDTTGYIAAVVFPYGNEQKLGELNDGAEIALDGILSINQYSGDLQIKANDIWRAKIDYSSIKTERPAKHEEADYLVVIPEKYVDEEQLKIDYVSDENKEIPALLRGKTFVVFDTETTGLNTSSDKIIELSAVKICNGIIVESFQTFVDPCVEIPSEIQELTHISPSDVVNAPIFLDVVPDFFKFTRGASLVGHNIDFDYKMLLSNSAESGYIFDNELLDTITLSKKALPSLPNRKLSTLAEYLGVKNQSAHRAISDAIATAKCFIKIAEMLK